MATFKAIVEPHYKRKDGTYNIKIRVIHNGRKRYISTQYYVTDNDLVRGNYKIKNQSFIDSAEDIIRTYRKKCDKIPNLSSLAIEQLVEELTKKTEGFRLDFVGYGRKVALEMREAGRSGNAKTYEVALNSLVHFAGRDSIDISEITAQYLERYIAWIDRRPAVGKRKKGGRAASLYLSNIRALHNRAKKEFNDEDRGIINIPFSPFSKVKIPPVPLSRKRALTAAQMRAVSALGDRCASQQGTNRYNLARDVFMLSFYLVGMNAVDLFSCTRMEKGRIIYNRTKTANRRADKAEISIRIEPEALPLVEKYRDRTGQRLFCFYQMYKTVNTFSMALNKGLKLIGAELGIEDLEFYAARHSWATIARNDCGISKDDIDLALNHVDENKRLADIYIKKDWSLIDTANRKVADLLVKPE